MTPLSDFRLIEEQIKENFPATCHKADRSRSVPTAGKQTREKEDAMNTRLSPVEWDPNLIRVKYLDDAGQPYCCCLGPRERLSGVLEVAAQDQADVAQSLGFAEPKLARLAGLAGRFFTSPQALSEQAKNHGDGAGSTILSAVLILIGFRVLRKLNSPRYGEGPFSVSQRKDPRHALASQVSNPGIDKYHLMERVRRLGRLPRWLLLWIFLVAGCCPRFGYSQEPTRAPQNTRNIRSCDSGNPASVVYCPDLIYATVGQTSLMLDVSYPSQGDGPYPAVILLHGAGPASKGRKGLIPWTTKLAQKGYVGIAVSYRCKPEDPFPAPVRDIQSVVRWSRDRAAQYKIDKNRLGLVGFSCGGCLACLVGMSPMDDNAGGQGALRDQSIQAVISYSAPTDLTRWYEGCVRDNENKDAPTKFMSSYVKRALEKWLGGSPSQVSDRYVKASPITHVRKDGPPILLIHGAADSIVPVEQSLLLANKLLGEGRRVSLLVLDNAPHDFDERCDAHAKLAADATWAFLHQHLREKR